MALRYNLIGIGLLVSCARTTSVARDPSPVVSDRIPPQLLRDNRFTLSYPEPLWRVGVQGSVVARLVVTPVGTVDTSALQIDSASNKVFTMGLRGALGNLHFTPARSGGKATAGTARVRLVFQIEQCDTTGGPRLEWTLSLDPAVVTLRQCRMPPGWVPHHLVRLEHAVLSGRWSTGFGSDVLYPCASEKLPMPYPRFVAPLISMNLHDLGAWPAVVKAAPPGSPQVKYFVRLEGELVGPDAVGQYGMAAYVFRPTHVVSAALWSERSCPLLPGAD